VLGAVGGFSALPRAQDLDLWLRVLEQGPGLATSVPSVRYHEHLTQASRDSELMREAFDSILNRYSDRPWLTSRVRSAAYGRVVWDDFRAAQRAREWPQAASRAFWLASHPPAWRAVALLLRQRRFGRDRGAAAKAAIGWPD
jgi:hypothetical protein